VKRWRREATIRIPPQFLLLLSFPFSHLCCAGQEGSSINRILAYATPETAKGKEKDMLIIYAILVLD
jgi:hypothetical protein